MIGLLFMCWVCDVVVLVLVARLTDSDGKPLPGKLVKFYKSINGVSYHFLGQGVTDDDGLVTITDEVTTPGKYYYRAVFEGDDDYEGSVDVKLYVVPQVPAIPWWLILIIILVIVLALAGGEERRQG